MDLCRSFDVVAELLGYAGCGYGGWVCGEASPTFDQQACFHDHKEWFAVFRRHTNQQQVQREAALAGLRVYAPQVWERLSDPRRDFCVYFMGAGNGGVEIPLLQELIATRGTIDNVRVHAEDPSEQMRTEFFHRAEDAGLASLISDYDRCRFDDDSYRPPQADFSLASQVWYYIDGWQDVPRQRNSLYKFAEILHARSGVGLITLYAATSDRYTLRSLLLTETGKPLEHTGEDVANELTRLGITFSVHIIESRTDISSCFRNGTFDPTDEGVMLLSFLLRAPWGDQPAVLQRKVGTLLEQFSATYAEPVMTFRDCYLWINPPRT